MMYRLVSSANRRILEQFLHTIIKKFLSFRAENSADILYLFRKHIMLAFPSLVNYIDQLTASVAITDFSPQFMVG